MNDKSASEWASKKEKEKRKKGTSLRNSCSKWLTVMLSEQCAASVTTRGVCVLTVHVQVSNALCTFVCECVRASLCTGLSGLSSTPNGLMGTLECLSSPPEWDTLRVWRSTKAQPCLRRGVSLWRGATAVLTVAGLMVITLPRGSALWTLKPRTSPLHTPPSRLNRGLKHTPVDHDTSAGGKKRACLPCNPSSRRVTFYP